MKLGNAFLAGGRRGHMRFTGLGGGEPRGFKLNVVWRRLVPLASLGLLLGGCAPITVNQERQLGAKVSREIQREGKVLRDYAVVEYVNDIGNRLLRAAGPQPFRYRFNVIGDDEINAFAAPAGYIYVNTGTILKARNVSELAGVIAHEIGHVVKRHIAANYNRAHTTSAMHQIGVMAAGIAGGQAAASLANAAGGFASMAYLNSFGRDAEREADVFAVRVMARAGYDPRGLVTFFETLKEESGPSASGLLSSHPATAERIADTNALIRKTSLPDNLEIADAGKLRRIQARISRMSLAQRRGTWR